MEEGFDLVMEDPWGIRKTEYRGIRSWMWFDMRQDFLLRCLGRDDACPGSGQFLVPRVVQQRQESPSAGAAGEWL